MRLIDAGFEILEQGSTIKEMLKFITKVGYTCYKTDKEITDEVAENFVRKLINSQHFAMLEHGTVYLAVEKSRYEGDSEIMGTVNYLLSMHLWTRWYAATLDNKDYMIIITNFRVIVENHFEEFMKRFWYIPVKGGQVRHTVKFITDRGVSHEIVRHRVMSFAQESTRYCNYSLDKFGKEISFIKPSWYESASDEGKKVLEDNLRMCEESYFSLIDRQFTPQQARQVLPNALKTEIVVSAFDDDWVHFFKLRALDYTGPAHPDMKALASPLYDEFVKRSFILRIPTIEEVKSLKANKETKENTDENNG